MWSRWQNIKLWIYRWKKERSERIPVQAKVVGMKLNSTCYFFFFDCLSPLPTFEKRIVGCVLCKFGSCMKLFFCLTYGCSEARYVENVEKKFLVEKRQRDLVSKRPREIKSATNCECCTGSQICPTARIMGLKFAREPRARLTFCESQKTGEKNTERRRPKTLRSERRRKLHWRWGHEEKDGRSRGKKTDFLTINTRLRLTDLHSFIPKTFSSHKMYLHLRDLYRSPSCICVGCARALMRLLCWSFG